MNVCEACGQPLPTGEQLTPRELDILSAWWIYGSVKRAAIMVDMAEQTAKNVLHRARIRSGVQTNAQLAALHIEHLRSKAALVESHNRRVTEAA